MKGKFTVPLSNSKLFFDLVRKDLFAGTLTQGQVDGINAIIDEADRRRLELSEMLAYILATSYHETNHRMQAISEMGGNAYFFRMYDINGDRPSVARELGNLRTGDGIRYHGRGHPQLTGRRNYKKMGELLSVDLEGNPELALDPVLSIKIMFEGMLRADSGFGDFTSRALEEYITPSVVDFVNARRTVNGLDRAKDIAQYARVFLAALTAGGYVLGRR